LPSPREGCLFCSIVREGTYVAKTRGFVAIDDINPQAEVHVLVIPERHVDTFRDIAEFHSGETKRMLEFVAEVAKQAGLTDYRVIANVGPSAGQTIFHPRVRRRGREAGRPHRLPRDRERRAERRPDDLPPTLARARQPERERVAPAADDGGDGAVTLIEELEEELKEATLARDGERRDALRLILASLRSAEKELQRPLSEDEELQVLQRERKKRLEAADAFRAAGREEQAEKEEAELDVLEEFMPEPLSEDELERIVDDAIAENKATSLRDMGRVMADVMPQVAGRADGSAVGQLVREKLA
jgi:uncharacterized protein YqeY/diadenosine tetraphosphate (Ap4A) HIT family hydrolase